MVDHEDYAEVVFEDSSVSNFDLVVGADGIFSNVRPAIEIPHYFYFGDLVWRGIVETDGVLCAPGTFIVYKRTKGLYANCYHLGDDKLHWAIYVERGVPKPVDNPSEVIGTVSYPSKEVLSKLEPAFVDAVLSTPKDDIVGRYSFDIDPLPRFKGNHVVLTGDAAHAQSAVNGAGVSMALMDAYALAQSMKKSSDLSEALNLYEQTTLPPSHDFQNNSRSKSLATGRTTQSKKRST